MSALRVDAVVVIDLIRAAEFAGRKHSGQHRKGEALEPYVNHLLEVACLLATATGGEDPNLIIAGLLHDTIEDVGVSREELEREFGSDVCGLVLEVTDDTSLRKEVRKQLQIERTRSPRAKMVKIADKISNLRSTKNNPPAGWSDERKADYFDWARKVVEGCRGVNSALERIFDDEYANGFAP